MRRLLTFECEGDALGATLDQAGGSTGVLFVTGGTQTRIGSHRIFERTAAGLARNGYPCFRFDRRGVGDSEGADPGFRRSAPDLNSAAASFRAQMPGLRRLIGFGLCDGATALALCGPAGGLDGIIMVNPWLVEASAGRPPAAAVRRHYAERLTSLEGWKRLLTGSVSYGKLLKGIGSVAAPEPRGLADNVADALAERPLPISLILARGDATAIAAESVWKSAPYTALRENNAEPIVIDTDSHTFARAGDEDALLAACLSALQQLGGRMAG